MARRILRPSIIVPVALVLVAVLAVGMYLFQPWKLFVDTTVNEASPLESAAAVVESPMAVDASPVVSTAPVPAPSPSAKKPKKAAIIATGSFITHEHGTTGTASVIQLANGKRVLRIENLDTSNGPDLKVWLSDQKVIEGTDGWFVFDDGEYVDLGALKGNKGNQNYDIPASVNIKDLDAVSIWCARFRVSFGAADLKPVSA